MPDPPDNTSDPSRPSLLKRWLGWRLLALTGAMLILLAPVLYRGWRLSQVPVIDEPFDVEEFRSQAEVPEDENAALLLLEAADKLVDVPEADEDAYLEESLDGWDPGDAILDRYLIANQPALEIWRTAAERPGFQFDPHETDTEANLRFYQMSRNLVRLADLRVEKSVDTGNPRAAIPWIEAMVQHASLIRQHSSEFNILVGIAYFAIASEASHKWSVHRDVQRQDIEHILATIREARPLKPPMSENVKFGYLINKETYGHTSIEDYIKRFRDHGMQPPLGPRWRWWLEAEPQFTQRLLPHIAENHLLFIDEPRRSRPPLIDGDLFDDSSLAPGRRGEVPAASLSRLMMQSHLLDADSSEYLQGILEAADKDEARYRCLTVALAAQAYCRDHGEFPAAAKQLVPQYLEEIPDDLYSPTPAPLIYRRDGQGAVVYSRYKNELDDGGSVVNYDERVANEDLLDFGFRIRNPFDRPLTAPKR